MTGNIHTLKNPQGHGSRDNNELFQLWYAIPIVTRYLISSLVVITTLNRLDIIPLGMLLYQFNETTRHFQIWRPFTSCIIPPFQAMPAMLTMYNIYSKSSQLEFRRNTLDYLFYLSFCITVISLTVALLFGTSESFILTSGFVSSLTYTWSLDNSNVKVMFYGLFPIWGKYFPLFELFLAFVFGEVPFMICLIGFLTSYLYVCLDTRTLGPIFGWAVGTRDPEYGIHPNGYFSAPNWFKSLLQRQPRRANHSSTQVNKNTGGQRLGGAASLQKPTRSTSESSSTSGHLSKDASSTNVRDKTTNQKSTNSFFPGSGKRLGG